MSEQESLRPLSESQMEALEEAVSRYQADISHDAMAYLIGRGIDLAAQDTFRLGVVSDPLPGHERFRGFLAIPYLDRHGKPLSIRFRCLQQHNHRDFGHGKYMSLPEEPPRIFNIKAIFDAGEEIHVTEGELDGIVLNSNLGPTVGVPGAHLWQPRHRIMLSGFNRIWVWSDPDEAGADLARKITRSLPRARQVRLTEGDVTDTYLSGGKDALMSLLPQRV